MGEYLSKAIQELGMRKKRKRDPLEAARSRQKI
jgi:hypothetical protein